MWPGDKTTGFFREAINNIFETSSVPYSGQVLQFVVIPKNSNKFRFLKQVFKYLPKIAEISKTPALSGYTSGMFWAITRITLSPAPFSASTASSCVTSSMFTLFT